MKLNTLLVFAFVATILITVRAEEIPDFLKVCRRNDTQLENCIKNSIETIKPYLAVGITDYEIPALEPLYIGDFIVAEDLPGHGLQILAQDTSTYGAANFIIRKLTVVEYAKLYKLQIDFPHMFSEGKYTIDGRIAFLPIKGSGDFQGNFTDVTSEVKIKLEKKKIKGEDHVVVSKLYLKITVKSGKLYLGNLFGGQNVALAELVNEAINQNFISFSKELFPLVEKALSRIFKQTSNKILTRFTEAQLFP